MIHTSSNILSWLSDALRFSVAAIGLLTLPAISAAQVSHPCLAPDSTSAAVVQMAISIVSDTAANVRTFRSHFGIPNGTAADVVLVQDNTVCAAATAAMDSVATPAQEAYHVIRIGSVNPFYLLAKRQVLVVGDVYVLNSQLALLGVLK